VETLDEAVRRVSGRRPASGPVAEAGNYSAQNELELEKEGLTYHR
jgi:hypothetical protein